MHGVLNKANFNFTAFYPFWRNYNVSFASVCVFLF